MTDSEGLALGVLGSLMAGLTPSVQIDAADFVKPSHRAILRACVALRASGTDPDPVLVLRWLRQAGEPEGLFLEDLGFAVASQLASAKTLDAYVRQLKAERRSRDMRAGALAVLEADASKAPEDMQEAVARINEAAKAPASQRAPTHVSHGLDRLFNQGPQAVLPFGIESLRDMDINCKHFVTVGARPSQGKTAMLGTVALAAAREGWDVLFLSLEMPTLEIQQRLSAAVGQIPLGDVKRADNPLLVKAVQDLSELSIWVEDGDEEPRIALDLEGICALMRLFGETAGPRRVVLLDYLQIVRTRTQFRTTFDKVAHVCRELKRAAKESGVALVVAAQLSRAVEQRGKEARPQLSDLSDSSEIEKVSDKIVFIHRVEGETPLLRVAKNRQGPCWTVEAAYRGELCQFTDAPGFGWQ